MTYSFRFLCLLTFAQVVGATVYNATPSTYTALVRSLRPGDTLNLAAGNYPFLSISGINGTPDAWITIAGPTSGAPATIYAPSNCCNTVQIVNSSYLAIQHLTIDSRGLAFVDGLKAMSSGITHDILVEGNTFIGQGGDQETVAISTKIPTWGWIIRRNTIEGAGTGMYLGNSDGTDPFIGGLIENNLVRNTIGYNMQVKWQTARPQVTGMPTGTNTTIIRNNVFIKNDEPSPVGDRPNVLVGGFPPSGAGSSDLYQIYGNFFYHNPRESLLQADGRFSIHDNVFVDGSFAAINVSSTDAPVQLDYIFNNTIYTPGYGVYVAARASVDDAVTGNLIFAGTPLLANVAHLSDNISDSTANAGLYVNAPSFTLGSMDFYPMAGKATGTALDLSKFTGETDYAIDFNGAPKGSSAVFRGAYAGEGVNPGWRLQNGMKTTPAPAPSLSGFQCQPGTITAGASTQCTASISAAAAADTAIAISAGGGLSAPPSVVAPAGGTAATFSVTAGAVATSQNITITATLGGGSLSQTITVNPAPSAALSSLSCAPSTLTSGASTACTVSLTAAAETALTVAVSSSNAALAAPASVIVNAGSAAAAFTATTSPVSSRQTAPLSATLNGATASFTVTLQPAFSFQGNNAEAPSLANGAAVTPSAAPAALAGTVVVRGTGAAAYSPLPDGNGLSFTKGGQQNTNTAFVAFSGPAIASLFSPAAGDTTFYVKSNHTFADRATSLASSTVFQVDDGANRVAYLAAAVGGSRLVFYFGAGGASGYYYVPAGQENTVFGSGVVAKFRLTWNGSRLTLYLNDTSVAVFSYTPAATVWKANASFTIGATSLNSYGGGYYATDDSVADFAVAGGGAAAAAPQAWLSPSAVTFSAQALNTSSAAQTVTLTNTGTAALSMSSITIGGANAAEFAQTNACGTSLVAGAACAVSVTFRPAAAGTRSATLTIADNAAGSPHTAALSGTGIGVAAVSLSPATLTFAGQALNTSSAAQTVTLTNTGTAALSISSITIAGANAAEFAQTNPCGTSLAAGASCAVSVTFRPAAAGTRSATLTIADNAAGSPHTAALSGTGIGVAAVSLSPATLTFAGQALNTSSAAQTVTLTNTGTAALTISSITIGGANAAEFAQSNACPASIAPAAGCTISVTFTPAAAGTRSAALTIADNAAGAPHAVALSGAGLAAGSPSFSLNGNSTELPSLVNGAAVTPSSVPAAGLSGKVVVRGAGAVAYAPQADGNGLSFTKGGQQNTNTAFLAFTGAGVSSLFDLAQGDLALSVKSAHSFSGRATALPSSTIFQADNGTKRIAYLTVSVESSRLVFYFGAGGGSGYYYVPAGREDTVYGAGVTVRFRIAWDGARVTLYINDASVAAFAYTPAAATWASNASFTIGASSLIAYGGGFYAADDSIADFRIR